MTPEQTEKRFPELKEMKAAFVVEFEALMEKPGAEISVAYAEAMMKVFKDFDKKESK